MDPSQQVSQSQIAQIDVFLERLLDNNIRLLCLDFDLTVCSIHTGGEVVVKNKIRPLFIEVFKIARNKGLEVAITTFHSLYDEVAEEVSSAFDLDKKIVVRSQENTEEANKEYFFVFGKTPMIASAWRAIFGNNSGTNKEIWKKSFLIDDDPENIKMARFHQCPALWFNTQKKTCKGFFESITNDSTTVDKFLVLPEYYKLPDLKKYIRDDDSDW